jgi:hypothetical protein
MSTNPTPQSVSAHLRRLGWCPVGGDRNRAGLRVSRGVLGAVRVVADLDAPAAAERMASDVADDLVGAGYTVVISGDSMYVSGGA